VLLASILLLLATSASGSSLRGAVVDARSGTAVAGARLRVVFLADTTLASETTTDEAGRFAFPGLPDGRFRLTAERFGFARLDRQVSVAPGGTDLGELRLAVSPLPLPPVVIRGAVPPAVQRADTTEFNARAFRTHPDATAEELLTKMPGVAVSNGTVTSNGETVQQVLVDGRPFFGSDPMIAVRNLPADVIDHIQIYDRLSDQAQFTGFDDGQSQKTINLVLRPEARNSQFGKAYGGLGDGGRYLTGGNANVLSGPTRLSLIGLDDNVNEQNFTAQDLLGVLNTQSRRGGFFAGGANGRSGGGRRRGGGGGGGGAGPFRGGSGFGPGGTPFGGIGAGSFLVGPQDGITSTQSLGANYAGNWGRRLTVDQSYFLNVADNRNDQSLTRLYAAPQDSIARYVQASGTGNRNDNQRLDSRIEWTLSPRTSVVDQPGLYFQSNHASSDLSGANQTALNATLSDAVNDNVGATHGHNLSNHLLVRHRFERRGRSVSLDIGLGHSLKQGVSALTGWSGAAPDSAAGLDTLAQRSTLRTTTSSASARLALTEPVSGSGLLQLTYGPRVSSSVSDNRATQLDPALGVYVPADTSLSNSFHTVSGAQSLALAYLYRRAHLNLSAETAWQLSWLRNRQIFPVAAGVDRWFSDVLPAFNLNYSMSAHRNLRVFYRASTRVPTVAQLQQVVDNSNALVLSTGNPALRPAVTHNLVGRFATTDSAAARSLFLFVSVQRTLRSIANQTFTATRESTLAGGLPLPAGAQLVTPVNLDGAWGASAFLTVGRPAAVLSSTWNLSGGLTWARTPSLIGALSNLADTYALSAGSSLNSNISEKVDFALSYTATWSLVRNSVATTSSPDYLTHGVNARLNLLGADRFVFRTALNGTLYDGVSGATNTVQWTASVGEKFLKSRRGELTLSGANLLDQGNATTRAVSDTYVQDARNTTLGRYVMLMFTYTLR
jgi:hypothetical protein